jgi:hypothetical protein
MRNRSLALPLFASWTLVLAACGGGGGGSSSPAPIPTNVLPVANAGASQSVAPGLIVSLDATGSSDADGSVTGYVWLQTAGTSVTLSSTTVAQPTFTAPSVGATTTLSFSLRVVDNSGASSNTATVNITVTPLTTGNVTGRVRFTRIPATNFGLNYAGGTLQPARGVLVLAVTPGTQAVSATDPDVLGSATTATDGTFGLDLAANTSYSLVAVARMLRDDSQPLPRWDVSVVDAEVDTSLPYTFTDGATRNSSTATTINYDIPSGHGLTGAVTGTRASAPFAILDTIYQGMQLVLGAAPATDFNALLVDWAPSNPGGETFFDPNLPQTIVLSADVTEDTDEFDQHVIAHEFGHYVEHNFSRADNIGGGHGLGDKLDIRIAFGEGFGYAFGAIVLNDPVSHDTFVNNSVQVSSTFNVESNPATTGPGSPAGNYGCWCSESSVWSILWDLYDSPADGTDTLVMGFAPLWSVLINQQRNTPAFTSIFSFISALKTARPADAAAIDTLLAAQNIGSVADAFGTGEMNFPNTAPNNVPANAALPVYTPVTVGGAPVVLRTVDDAGRYNTLGNHRFLRFSLASARPTLNISVTSSNPAVDADPDFVLYGNGAPLDFLEGQDGPPQPEGGVFNNVPAGTYIIDVYDCANGCTSEQGTPGDYDLTVTVN